MSDEAHAPPGALRVRRLDNGLRVVLLPRPSGGRVSYWSVVRVGSRDESEPGKSGFAHFFEHMMFRGSERFSAVRTNEIATRMGAQWNAFTSFDLTAYHYTVAGDALPEVVELEADRFQRLRYDEQAFRDEAGAVLGEYRKSLSSPAFALHERLVGSAFVEHPYGHTVLGRREDIEAMPGLYDHSWDFFDRHYRPENTVIVIVGDVDVPRALDLVERHYASWTPGHRPAEVPPEPPQEQPRSIEIRFPGRALARLVMAHRFVAHDPASRSEAAARALAELAFGRASALYADLVVERSIAESLAATVDRTLDPRLFCLHATTRDDDALPAIVGALESTIEAWARRGPEAERLEAYKRRRRYAFELGFETPEQTALLLGRAMALRGDVGSVWVEQKTSEALTPDDLRDAARVHLDPARRTTGLLRGADA